MELSKNYDFGSRDNYWYQRGEGAGNYTSSPDDRPAYTIVIPPPNVTGVLHMGHALNETVQDILARRARMHGYNVCWVPGSDHASIATEAKVVNMLHERGIDKKDISREEFLEYAFEWKDKYGGIIMDQIKKLGCTCDWTRNTFTMDDEYYSAVIQVFIQLYNEGLIYRGARMINWDPAAQTALSDEEVEFRDERGKLYYIKYFLLDESGNTSSEYLEVATRRPETIMGDSGVCVNPNDERYQKWIGKKVRVPLTDRDVEIIADDYVEIEFGTGVLKVTPAHDIHDYEIGLKHNLEVIDTLTDEGNISEAAGIFVGMDRDEARKAAVAQLEEDGQLIKIEEYDSRLGYSQRTGVVVEPKISTQWFMKMTEMAQVALDAVEKGEVNIYPHDRFIATYRHWLTDTKDWCISRQLWWGQRIPAFYDENGNYYVAENLEKALIQAQQKDASIQSLRQDSDCLDTWFSSWIWPIEVFKGISHPDQNRDFEYYFPTTTLVTGQDIIFFWVARMIMASYKLKNMKPFQDVYFTGIVRDDKGRKMSKSLGNSPDLLKLIEDFGADAVRFGIMVCSPAGNDLLFSEDYIAQGRNFANKIWNALRLIDMWKKNDVVLVDFIDESTSAKHYFHIDWMWSKVAIAQQEIDTLFGEYKISQSLMVLYNLIWDDFCSWYLEWAKPAYGTNEIDGQILNSTIDIFKELLAMLNPFMPFITEEVYLHLQDDESGPMLMMRQGVASADKINEQVVQNGERLKSIISDIRNLRTKNQLKNKEQIAIVIDTEDPEYYTLVEDILAKQVNALQIELSAEVPVDAQTVVVGNDKLYISSDSFQNNETEDTEQLEKDLEYYEGFLNSVEKKLQNEKFVNNAKPEVVDAERKKKADALGKIAAIREVLGQS